LNKSVFCDFLQSTANTEVVYFGNPVTLGLSNGFSGSFFDSFFSVEGLFGNFFSGSSDLGGLAAGWNTKDLFSIAENVRV